MTDGWVRTERGTLVKRYGPPPTPNRARSDYPCPSLIRDFDEPVQSMADGRMHHSKASLAASHRASGNPQGIDYVELGNDNAPFVEHVPDARKRRDDVAAAAADVKAGNVPDWIKAI